MRSVISIFSFFLLLVYYSFTVSPGFSETSSIEFLGLSKDSLNQDNLFSDSIFLTISFRDGDGDLGTGADGVFENVRITDNRTGELYDRFRIPPLDIAGSMTGIEGRMTLKLFTTCCRFPDGTPPCLAPEEFPTNNLSLDIQMIDDSGNESNMVTTSLITLLCN